MRSKTYLIWTVLHRTLLNSFLLHRRALENIEIGSLSIFHAFDLQWRKCVNSLTMTKVTASSGVGRLEARAIGLPVKFCTSSCRYLFGTHWHVLGKVIRNTSNELVIGIFKVILYLATGFHFGNRDRCERATEGIFKLKDTTAGR